MKKCFALLLALVVFAMAGCASNDPAPVPDGPRESITLANTAAIPDYDPMNWYLTSQSTLFTNVYSTLVDVISADDLSVVCRPNLAKSWETEDDGLVWVFHLNENAVYSDGSKVTADHVKTCFERQMTNPYTMSYVAMIDSIEVRDENTVAFRLSYKWPSVPNCWYMIAIYNVDLYDADKDSYIKNPVGSGPYTLTSLDETAGTMTMTLKDNWWGDEKPAIKTINVRTITDPSTLVIALQKGEIDVSSLMGSSLRLVEGDKNLVMKQSISVVPFQLLINANTEPLNNGKLREAISYAIDYNAIRIAVWTAAAALLLATPLTLLFCRDAQVIPLVEHMVMLYAPFILFLPGCFILPNGFKAVGDARYAMIFSSVSAWAIRVGGMWLLGLRLGLGTAAIVLTQGLDHFARHVAYKRRYRGDLWLRELTAEHHKTETGR